MINAHAEVVRNTKNVVITKKIDNMKKYRCLTDVFQEVPGRPIKGVTYDGDYIWGLGIVTVEELAELDPEDWEIVLETPKPFSIEAENIHMRKAMIDDLEKIGYKFDGKDLESGEWFIIQPKLSKGYNIIYMFDEFNGEQFTLPGEYTKALEFAKEQLDIFHQGKEPEYVPFTFDDREIFRDRWVKSKIQDLESRMLDIGTNGIRTHYSSPDFVQAFHTIEFTDGTPFGKLKE